MMKAHILELAKTGAISCVSKILDITDTRIWHVVRYWVDKCRTESDYSSVCNAGIEETSKKGLNYLTSFVDLDKHKVIYIAKWQG